VTAPSEKNRSPFAALALGWVLPGAGHAYAGRWGKAILFFSLITALMVAGLVIGKGTNILPNRLWYAAQVCAGGPAIALTPISQYLAGPNEGNVDWADPLHEMGTLYTAVAGFLNLLVMMDAYTRLAYPGRSEEQQEGA
jgi:TM2 domain-containing membrane protein YozV